MAIACFVGSGAAVAAFGAVPANFQLLQLAAFVLGFLANGAVVGLYALMARTFPTTLRASGTGAVIGIGRIGAVCGPLLAGYLLAAGAGRGLTSNILALGSVGAALVLIAVAIRPADGD